MTSSNAWASPALQRTPGPAGEFLRICSGRVNPGSALGIAGHASSPGALLEAAESEMNRGKACARAGLPHNALHGLRRSFESLARRLTLQPTPAHAAKPRLRHTTQGVGAKRRTPRWLWRTDIPCAWNDRGLARAPA